MYSAVLWCILGCISQPLSITLGSSALQNGQPLLVYAGHPTLKVAQVRPPPLRACFPVPPAVPLLVMMARILLLLLLLLPLTAGGYSWRLIARHYISPAMGESFHGIGYARYIAIGSAAIEVRVGVLFIAPPPFHAFGVPMMHLAL